MRSQTLSRTRDMTEGQPLALIFAFAGPIFLGNLFQQLYNLADTAIAGHLLGDAALAQIGATAALYSLVVGFAFGLNAGFSLLVSRAFGARDEAGLRRATAWMVTLAAAWAAALTLVLYFFLPQVLGLLNTPPEAMDGAAAYISTIFLGFPLTMAYNLESGLLRAMGNSLTPLLFLMLSCLLNVGFDYAFLAYFGLGVRGAALATVLSQGISAVLCFLYIVRAYPQLRLHRADWAGPRGFVGEMQTTGLSMALMSTIFAIGSVVLQSAVNALGSTYIAAQVGGRRLVELFMMPQSAFSTANATFASQNFGAGKRRRIWQGVVTTCCMCFVWDVVGTVYAFTLADASVRLITGSTDPEVLTSAVRYIRFSIPMFPPMAVLIVLRNTLQGMRHRIAPLLCSAVEMVGKFLFSWAIVPAMGYTAVCACEPVTWVLCFCVILAFTFHWRAEFRDGDARRSA